MQSQLTVRLPENSAHRVAEAARRLWRKRSDIVRLAIEHYLGGPLIQEEPAPYERVKHLVVPAEETGIHDILTLDIRGYRSYRVHGKISFVLYP